MSDAPLKPISWRRWKLGCWVSLGLSLFVAGAGLVAGMRWQAFVAVFCAACVTHWGAWVQQHPVESITFGDTTPPFKPVPAGQGDLTAPPSAPQPKEK